MTGYRPGDVALAGAGGGIVAAGIEVVTRSPVHHARIVVDTDGGTVEAGPPRSSRGHVHHDDIVFRPPLTDAQVDALPAAAEQLLGVRYSFIGDAVLGLAQLGIRWQWVTDYVGREDWLFCSQLVDLALFRVGFHVFDDGRPFQNVSPGDLLLAAVARGWQLIQAGSLAEV